MEEGAAVLVFTVVEVGPEQGTLRFRYDAKGISAERSSRKANLAGK
jgi:hypothetical protein